MIPIKGYENLYSIDKNGNVYSHRRNRYLKQHKNSKGYFRVSLTKKNKRSWCSIHRLLMYTFIGISKLSINHIDGIKTNNCLSNLEYLSISDNLKHASLNGLLYKRSGENHYGAKLNWKIVNEIRKNYIPRKTTLKILASRYKVTPGTILNIIKNKTWASPRR